MQGGRRQGGVGLSRRVAGCPVNDPRGVPEARGMATRTTYDVAIIGASIGGCTAATLYGRCGLRVALVERQPDAAYYKKICTHFIQASATPTIERLGLAGAIEAAGGIRNSVEVWTRWGWLRPYALAGDAAPHGYNIRRQVLDPTLRALAADTPGVDLMLGYSARGLLTERGRVRGVSVVGRDGGTMEIAARLVVGADGRNSRVAALSGLPAMVQPHNRFAYFAYYRDLPLVTGTVSQMWMLDPDVGYAFPNGGGLTLVACFCTKDKLAAFKRDPGGNFRRFFARLPNAPSLDEERQVSPLLGMVNMPNVSRPAARPGLALVGDAALASDPLWGIGCGWAFQSAEWLVDATGGAFESPVALDRGLRQYAERHRSNLRGHHAFICNYATGRRFNPIERLMIAAAVKDPVAARHLAALVTGQIGPRAFLSPTAIGRAAWANLTGGVGLPARRGAGQSPRLMS